jgi:hypothetical protein
MWLLLFSKVRCGRGMNARAAVMLHRGYSSPGKLTLRREDAMLAAVPVALLFAQAASAAPADASQPNYGPATQAAPKSAEAAVKPPECAPQTPASKSNEIVVCAVKPQGYRIDPDVLAARRMKKKGDPGTPRNPHESYADHSCATVGPMGCRGGAGFNVVGAAMAAATMIDKAVKGENVAQALVTDPTQNEYKLYQEAKREREEKEAQKAAQSITAQVKAEKAAKAARAAQAAPAKTQHQPANAAPQE